MSSSSSLSRGKTRARSRAALSRLAAVLLLLLLVWHAFNSSVAYFVDWAQAEPAQRIYNADFLAVAAYLDKHKTDEPVYAGTDRLFDLDQRVYKLYIPDGKTWFGSRPKTRRRSGRGPRSLFYSGFG